MQNDIDRLFSEHCLTASERLLVEIRAFLKHIRAPALSRFNCSCSGHGMSPVTFADFQATLLSHLQARHPLLFNENLETVEDVLELLSRPDPGVDSEKILTEIYSVLQSYAGHCNAFSAKPTGFRI